MVRPKTKIFVSRDPRLARENEDLRSSGQCVLKFENSKELPHIGGKVIGSNLDEIDAVLPAWYVVYGKCFT